ncbi:MAG TPA: DUF5701 family protein [Nocardioidaceae bacterium]|nr:DUF5701 family protein [Nocardioidaceae bacterium]
MTPVAAQVERLVELGVADLAGVTEGELRKLAGDLVPDDDSAVLAVHPRLVAASLLAPLLSRGGKPGFVVVDMDDLDAFEPIEPGPSAPLYLVHGIDRGDDLANWSPDEALPELRSRGRRPLTVNEGISWLLQQPEQLQPNHCFMTIGSRKPTSTGLDTRTPAIWISGGTGRDGKERKGAPKVGWCWAGNRHTWLGFASSLA